MNGLLTLDEIKDRFPSEWVLIGDPQTDDSLEILTGEVLYHSLDRDEVDRKLLELRPSRFALRYLGSMPDDMALVLGASLSTRTPDLSSSEPRFQALSEAPIWSWYSTPA